MSVTLFRFFICSDAWVPERDAAETAARLQALAAAPAFDRLAFQDAVEASRKQARPIGSSFEIAFSLPASEYVLLAPHKIQPPGLALQDFRSDTCRSERVNSECLRHSNRFMLQKV